MITHWRVRRAASSTPPIPAHDRPLAISLLLGASGWVAGVFMLIFVAMLFHPDNAGQAAVSGAVLLAAAWGLFKVDRDGEQVFVAQLALALSIAGQCLMLFAMSEHAHGIAPIASAALPLQTVLALAMPNRLHRTLSTLFATIAWALTLRFALFGEPDLWHGGSASPVAALPAALAGWLLAWGPVVAGLWWAIRRERAWTMRGWQPVLRPIAHRADRRPGVRHARVAAVRVVPLDRRPRRGRRRWARAVAAAVGARRTRRGGRGVRAAAACADGGVRGRGAGAPVALLLRARHQPADQVAADAGDGRRVHRRGARVGSKGERMKPLTLRALIALGALLVLGALNFAIVGKERIRRDGEVVYLPLAPVDPRSLIQGDYMALRFALARDIERRDEADLAARARRRSGVRRVALDDQRYRGLAGRPCGRA